MAFTPLLETTPAMSSFSSDDSLTQQTGAGTTDQPQSLSRTTGSGFSWLTVSLVVGKLCSFATQLVLGWLLFQEDFGLLAVAASIANFVKVFNDAGTAQVLIQRGREDFARLTAPAFYLGAAFGITSASVLALTAPALARLYGDERLVSMLWVFALTVVLSTPVPIFKASLRQNLRFQALSWLSAVWFLLRYGGTIVLAYRGYGAMSFVLPLPFVTVFEAVAGYALTRVNPFRLNWSLATALGILVNSTWVVLASLARGLARNGDYLVLGLLVAQGVVGQYFFGYQLTSQFAVLMFSNIQFVLFPVLSRLASNPERQANATLRTVKLMMLVSAPVCLLVAVNIRALEMFLWSGKYAAAVPLMQVFSVVAPIRLMTDVIHAAVTARGEFRRSAGLLLVEGLVLVGGAWLGVVLCGENLTGIACVVGGSQAAFALVLTAALLIQYGMVPHQIVAAVLPAWGSSLAALALTWAVGSRWYGDGGLILQIVANTILFTAIFLILMRVLFMGHLRELASVVPLSLARVLRRTLYLPDSYQSA